MKIQSIPPCSTTTQTALIVEKTGQNRTKQCEKEQKRTKKKDKKNKRRMSILFVSRRKENKIEQRRLGHLLSRAHRKAKRGGHEPKAPIRSEPL